MHSLTRVTTTLLLALVAAAPFSSADAQPRPSAADVIAKYVAAIGGKSEIMKLTSMRQAGTVEIVTYGASGTVELLATAPNKQVQKMNIPNMMDMQNGFDGSVGWDYSPQQGARLLVEKELLERKEGADFQADMLYTAERYASMETVGDTTINGEKSWKVKLVKKLTGKESQEYFSASTGLLLLSVEPEVSEQNLEYKKFGSIMVPTKVAIQQGPVKMMLTITEVAFNSVPESAHALPDAVRQLIKP